MRVVRIQMQKPFSSPEYIYSEGEKTVRKSKNI